MTDHDPHAADADPPPGDLNPTQSAAPGLCRRPTGTERRQPTRVVAFESATQPGSIALLAGPDLVHFAPLDPRIKTTRQFTRTLHEGLQAFQWRPIDIGLLAVCRGPGSFTGLRIAITLAKLWAYAHSTPVVAVSTLRLIAHQLPHDPSATHAAVCLDAQRQQWFAALYEQTGDGWVEIEAPAVVHPQAWLDHLSRFPGCWLTGPGFDLRQAWRFPPSLMLAPLERRAPQASELGKLALERLRRGAVDDPWRLLPEYLRSSAAEERRAAGAAGPAEIRSDLP